MMNLKDYPYSYNFQLNVSLRYHSKSFNITTDWDGGNAYTITVTNERTKKVLEVVEARTGTVNESFQQLKTKYIFDYDNVLSASRSENAGAYHFSRERLFSPQNNC